MIQDYAKRGRRKRRILIVDDHPIIRRGLAEVLAREPDMEVCGGADNVADALKELEATHPDLVVVDMTLKDSHGIELVSEINSRDQRRSGRWSGPCSTRRSSPNARSAPVPWATSTRRSRSNGWWKPSARCSTGTSV